MPPPLAERTSGLSRLARFRPRSPIWLIWRALCLLVSNVVTFTCDENKRAKARIVKNAEKHITLTSLHCGVLIRASNEHQQMSYNLPLWLPPCACEGVEGRGT